MKFMYRIFWLNVTSFSQQGRMADTIQEHIHMLNLIQNHDTRALEQLMEHHLTVAQNINLELLK